MLEIFDRVIVHNLVANTAIFLRGGAFVSAAVSFAVFGRNNKVSGRAGRFAAFSSDTLSARKADLSSNSSVERLN